MSEFCKQCSIKYHGKDSQDFRDDSKKLISDRGLYRIVICEGCGVIQVDYKGKCMGEDCDERGHH